MFLEIEGPEGTVYPKGCFTLRFKYQKGFVKLYLKRGF